MKTISRRHFLGGAAASAVAIVFPSFLVNALAATAAKPVALPAGAKEVPLTDPVAQAIGYRPHVKDIDYAKYPDRKKPANKNQFCHNCALFTAENASWGKCSLLTAGLVASEGWCGSYSKKA